MDTSEQQSDLGQFVALRRSQIYPGGPHGPLTALFTNSAEEKTDLTYAEVQTRLKNPQITESDKEALNRAIYNFRFG